MNAESRAKLDVPSSEMRAGAAQRVLERTRREASSLISAMASNGQRLEFPRSALLRWLTRSVDRRMGGPLAMTLVSFAGRMLIHRFFARRRGSGLQL